MHMDTVRKTYEHDPQVQKIIAWQGMHCDDKMKESYMSVSCSDAYLAILRKRYSHFQGLIMYLDMMNHVYHGAASDKTLDEVLIGYKSALNIAESMRLLTEDLDGVYGVTDATYKSLKLNVDGVTKLLNYINTKMDPSQFQFSTRLLLTNRLEIGRAHV